MRGIGSPRSCVMRVTKDARDVADSARHADLRVVVIGAGMSGLLAAIELDRAGFENVLVYEKGDRVGGTWHDNTYPGIACDVPSHFYSYSFALNPDWSHRFSPGDEIQAYFEDVARRYDVESRIRFGREVVRCEFADGRWRLTLADGDTDDADFVIAATGVLHHPNVPEILGLASFEGAVFHSARWNHDVELAGKRVGVVGTGSSAIQIVAAVVDDVARLTLFQRTPQWIAPMENPAYGDAEREEFRLHPETMQAVREEIAQAFTHGFANALIDAESPILAAIQQACESNLENSVRDPVLREKLRPDYRATCKRLVLSDGFYEAIQRDNAELVSDRIERVETDGLRTADGRLHPLDVLVLATGFRVSNFVRPMQVTGRGGIALDDVWRAGPTAHLSIAMPDFPNFFLLQGPSSPVGNFSLIEVAELQVGYILQLIELVRAGRAREVAPTAEAARRYEAERREAAKSTIWASGCRSWYIGQDGLPIAWPFRFDRFRDEMKSPRLEDYELR
jgi:cation diffusion facilitator CzcD-associated flavoprotein CzcO